MSLELFMRVGVKPPVGVLPYGPASECWEVWRDVGYCRC